MTMHHLGTTAAGTGVTATPTTTPGEYAAVLTPGAATGHAYRVGTLSYRPEGAALVFDSDPVSIGPDVLRVLARTLDELDANGGRL